MHRTGIARARFTRQDRFRSMFQMRRATLNLAGWARRYGVSPSSCASQDRPPLPFRFRALRDEPRIHRRAYNHVRSWGGRGGHTYSMILSNSQLQAIPQSNHYRQNAAQTFAMKNVRPCALTHRLRVSRVAALSSAALHFPRADSMAPTHSWQSRTEVAFRLTVPPPRGYARTTWKS